MLKGRQAQCPICSLIFTSDAMCEKHKPYANPKTDNCKDPASISMVLRDRGWTVPVPDDAKWWSTTTKAEAVPAGPQILTCAECNIVWERPAQRGRKPKLCGACKLKETNTNA